MYTVLVLSCHPDDMDMCSEKTGYQIAFQKVIIQIHKACRDDIKSQICALERLYYSMKHSKQFNPNSYENKSLQRQLRLSKNALTTTNQDIVIEEENLRTFIKNKDEFYKNIGSIRKKVGDRAVLRAIHFFDENDRVDGQREALKKGDIKGYFEGVEASGNSSEYNLQNIFPCCSVTERSISLALTMAKKAGADAVRVHGGGFAGTIQAYVPTEKKDSFVKYMENCFGEDCCFVLSIRPCGFYTVIE